MPLTAVQQCPLQLCTTGADRPPNEAHIPQTLKDIFLSNIMVNRYGCPEDIAHACVYFGADESSYVTGQIITVDGGLNSHTPTAAQFRSMGARTW